MDETWSEMSTLFLVLIKTVAFFNESRDIRIISVESRYESANQVFSKYHCKKFLFQWTLANSAQLVAFIENNTRQKLSVTCDFFSLLSLDDCNLILPSAATAFYEWKAARDILVGDKRRSVSYGLKNEGACFAYWNIFNAMNILLLPLTFAASRHSWRSIAFPWIALIEVS